MTDASRDTPDTTPDATHDGALSRDTPDAPDIRDTSPRDPGRDTVSPRVPIADAAALAGVSVRTLQRAVKRGELRCDRRDGRATCPREDVVSWAAARVAPGPTIASAPTDATRPHEPAAVALVAPAAAASPELVESQARVRELEAENAGLRDERDYLRGRLEAQDETVRAMAGTIAAMQAAAVPPRIVEAVPTGNAPQGLSEGLQRTISPSAGDSSSKRRRRPRLWPRRLWPW